MEWIKQIWQLIILVLLQVLLFDHLQIAGWGIPMVYVLFLVNLPIQIPRWVEMLIGFAVGLLIDMWNNSLGVHIAACTAVSYLRPFLLHNLIQDIDRVKGEICSNSIGFAEYFKCLVILILIHHSMVFGLESFSWNNWWMVIIQTIISSVISIAIIIGYDRIIKG